MTTYNEWRERMSVRVYFVVSVVGAVGIYFVWERQSLRGNIFLLLLFAYFLFDSTRRLFKVQP